MTSPVPGVGISTPFGQRGRHWSMDRDARGNGVHTGDDYAASAGTPILAIAAGRVVSIAYDARAYGHFVVIEHAGGLRSYSCHMRERTPFVNVGQHVAEGQAIGRVGMTGNATGPHLHLEVRRAPYTFTRAAIVDPAVITNQEDDMALDAKTIEAIAARVWLIKHNELDGLNARDFLVKRLPVDVWNVRHKVLGNRTAYEYLRDLPVEIWMVRHKALGNRTVFEELARQDTRLEALARVVDELKAAK